MRSGYTAWMVRVPRATACLVALCCGAQAQTAGEAFRIGTLYLRDGDWPEAIEYLQKSSALRPRHVDTLYYLAQAYYLDGQHEPARKTILRAAPWPPAGRRWPRNSASTFAKTTCARRASATCSRRAASIPRFRHRLRPGHGLPQAGRTARGTAAPGSGRLKARTTWWPRVSWPTCSAGRTLGTRGASTEVVDRPAAPRTPRALYGPGRALVALGDSTRPRSPVCAISLAAPTPSPRLHFQLGTGPPAAGARRAEEHPRELALFKALRDRTSGSTARSSAASDAGRGPGSGRRVQGLLAEGKEAEALAYPRFPAPDRAVRLPLPAAGRALLRPPEAGPTRCGMLTQAARPPRPTPTSWPPRTGSRRRRAGAPRPRSASSPGPSARTERELAARWAWASWSAPGETGTRSHRLPRRSETTPGTRAPEVVPFVFRPRRAIGQGASETAELVRAFGSGDAARCASWRPFSPPREPPKA